MRNGQLLQKQEMVWMSNSSARLTTTPPLRGLTSRVTQHTRTKKESENIAVVAALMSVHEINFCWAWHCQSTFNAHNADGTQCRI